MAKNIDFDLKDNGQWGMTAVATDGGIYKTGDKFYNASDDGINERSEFPENSGAELTLDTGFKPTTPQ